MGIIFVTEGSGVCHVQTYRETRRKKQTWREIFEREKQREGKAFGEEKSVMIHVSWVVCEAEQSRQQEGNGEQMLMLEMRCVAMHCVA